MSLAICLESALIKVVEGALHAGPNLGSPALILASGL